ncbi:MAG: hypothetical protein IT374_04820 [Polyangiaceae bacterium]|nr:hypothetical protein [Polyangiaceae bacterium]
MSSLSREASSLLRALARSEGRAVSGEALMERLFAMTTELPLDPARLGLAVDELVALGLAVTTPGGDAEFSFGSVALTPAGVARARA